MIMMIMIMMIMIMIMIYGDDYHVLSKLKVDQGFRLNSQSLFHICSLILKSCQTPNFK